MNALMEYKDTDIIAPKAASVKTSEEGTDSVGNLNAENDSLEKRKIPVGFLKYLKGQEYIEHAILKRDSKRWLIKLNDKRFEKGWGKFAEQNDVQLGDMLVFRHDGNMEFDVCIIDSTHCDREYAEYLHEERGGGLIQC
ncbi:hypothetical protein CQW23_18823 [Capsicum baccatum]|uniref:TF-B3 domain-containing protein n=1 Tax=Capsicum baccatum TaxID=33114 RepID=A0A2G2W457_CAPBA|nr:hypothetical protein CQW23_18823 [Capsicum baccatum]